MLPENFGVKSALWLGQPVIDKVDEKFQKIEVDRRISSYDAGAEISFDRRRVLNCLSNTGRLYAWCSYTGISHHKLVYFTLYRQQLTSLSGVFKLNHRQLISKKHAAFHYIKVPVRFSQNFLNGVEFTLNETCETVWHNNFTRKILKDYRSKLHLYV